ncbi:hypothetical protein Tco_1245040 [Tanacetum coccineum]
MHLPLRYQDGVTLDMADRRMPYEEFAKILEEKVGKYFQDLTISVDKGKEKVGEVDSDYDSEFDTDYNSEYASDKLVDYLSPSEEELIELRNRMKENRERKVAEKNSDLNEPTYDNIHADNIRIEKARDKYPMYGESTHWRFRHPKRNSGEKVVAKCEQRLPKITDKEKGKQRSKANPEIRLVDITDLVMKKYNCKVTPNQCTNAKKYVLTKYNKTIKEHYAMLRSYGREILDSNLRPIVNLGVTVNPNNKVYLDSPNPGEIHIAIRGDGNNHIYPVAYVVVNVEKKDKWTWFLELLESDFWCIKGQGLTLMSDQHKMFGISCHMLNIGNVQGKTMRALGSISVGWSLETSENGFSECFYSVILSVRNKPLITMLEAMRVIILERMNTMREINRKWNLGVCPNIKNNLE